MTKKKKKVVNRRFARKGEYDSVLKTIEKRGKCPFCPDNFKYHKNPILKKRCGWFVTKISWPYKNTKHHFIIISDKHRENIQELIGKDMESILYLAKWIVSRYKIRGGGLAMRFGNSLYTGATVCHIHAHLIVPKRGKTVNFPIG